MLGHDTQRGIKGSSAGFCLTCSTVDDRPYLTLRGKKVFSEILKSLNMWTGNIRRTELSRAFKSYLSQSMTLKISKLPCFYLFYCLRHDEQKQMESMHVATYQTL